MKKIAYCVIFILSLLRLRQPNIIKLLSERYGQTRVKLFRRTETTRSKLIKSELDLDFLKKCKTYDVMPKFLRFKLHRKALHSSQFYKSWMIKLLDKEIREKELTISSCKECYETELSALLSESNIWDRIVIKRSLDHSAKIFTTKTKIDLDRKLEKLCITNQLRPCDLDKTFRTIVPFYFLHVSKLSWHLD